MNRPRDAREAGFTLIELMVVVLIIGILIAIALPTFLGARARAQDKQAQSGLRNALAAAKTLYTDGDTYTNVNHTTLPPIEPALTFVNPGTSSSGPTVVSVHPAGSTTWVAAAASKSGVCFAIKDVVGSGVSYAKGIAGGCNATNADATGAFGASW